MVCLLASTFQIIIAGLSPALTIGNSDEDLSGMYLSAKQMNEPRSIHDHEELELLLESFAKQVEEIMGEVDTIAVSCSRLIILMACHRAYTLFVVARWIH